MSYQSLDFVFFSTVVLALYYLLGRRMQKWVLAAANITFYAVADIKYIPFLLATMLVTFFVGRSIGKVYAKTDDALAACQDAAEKKALRAAGKSRAKRRLMVALIVSIGLLVVCRYTVFAIENVNGILSAFGRQPISLFKIIVPLGVSFYTFMAISYVLDIYWKRYKAEKSFIYYAVWLSYFPHVVQGPIDRFNEFKVQIAEGVRFKYENLTYGAQLALWGFFKKLVIADRLGIFVGGVIDNSENYGGWMILLALAIYSIQIYTDFSGCIDIITGVSEAFGIKLRKNFNHPYFSTSMPEFWRRWHISLQEWFKDYIYFPVSSSGFTRKIKKHYKNKGKKRAEELFASCFPMLVVWLITGIWHGADWTFFIWGLFHAALLTGSRVFEPTFNGINKLLHINTQNWIWKFWQMLRTFALCCIGRIFFRAESIQHALGLIGSIFTKPGSITAELIASTGFTKDDVVISAVAVLVLLVVDILQEKMSVRDALAKQSLVIRWPILYALIIAIIVFGIYGPNYDASSFIYEQF